MNDTVKILALINEGEAEKILSEPNLVQKLNKLNEHDLIEMKDGIVVLSEKGRAVHKSGETVIVNKDTVIPLNVRLKESEPGKKNIRTVLIFGFILIFIMSLLVGFEMTS